MGILEETLKGKSLADYTNTQLRLALGAVLYTNTADMWKRYLNQLGYVGDVSQMLQKYYADYNVPSNFRNYINAGASIFNPQNMFAVDAALQGYVYDINDLSTLFLDSALTTPATVNGLVGGIVDKSGRGNHATQTITGSKPILRGTPTGAELFTAYGTPGAGWSVAGATGTATTASSALPTTTAATVGKHYRVTYTVTRSAGSVQLSFGGRTGVSRSAAGQYVEYFDNALNTNALTATGTGFTGTVRIDEAKDVSAGSVTAPYGLQFDGVDDLLQTASVDFTTTDKITVCHGVRKLSDANEAGLLELSSNYSLNNGTFAIFAPGGISVARDSAFVVVSKGTSAVFHGPTAAAFPAPVTSVITMINNIAGDSSLFRVNTTQVSSSISDQGTGNFGNYPLYFGSRSGAVQPYHGLFYSAICVGKTASAAELANIERWVNLRTGAY